MYLNDFITLELRLCLNGHGKLYCSMENNSDGNIQRIEIKNLHYRRHKK